jgi:hypothetical protein
MGMFVFWLTAFYFGSENITEMSWTLITRAFKCLQEKLSQSLSFGTFNNLEWNVQYIIQLKQLLRFNI